MCLVRITKLQKEETKARFGPSRHRKTGLKWNLGIIVYGKG